MAVAYSDLTNINLRLAHVRARVDLQREHIQKLRTDGHNTSDSEAVLRKLLRVLESFEETRRRVEDELFKAKVAAPRRSSGQT